MHTLLKKKSGTKLLQLLTKQPREINNNNSNNKYYYYKKRTKKVGWQQSLGMRMCDEEKNSS